MTKLELLSPAKNLETGIAAINAGADAVYIGAENFGARSAAGNSIQDIEKLINYAHIFHAKVYLTVNTILYENEIPKVLSLINTLYNCGLDAVIIQDMGILELDLPPIKIFASTQTNNQTSEKVKFLENVGISRVILARELSVNQIKAIKNETNVDLEAFIHGALCVSYSGQCYLSEHLVNRSANRGECSQACRSSYDLIDANGKIILKNKHLLSLKDLNLAEKIEDLAKAGITSFKIEGRLKNISFVKNVTAFYRQILDNLIEKNAEKYERASVGKSTYSFVPDVNKVFNRGFTQYFNNERNAEMGSFDTPKSIGEFLGLVKSISKDNFVIETDKKINNNDGLIFFKNAELKGIKVNTFSNEKVFADNLEDLFIGAKIFRNHDQEFTKITENEESAIRKINIKLYVSETLDGVLLNIIDEQYITSIQTLVFEKQIANKPEKAIQNIKEKLSKCGNTPFNVLDVEIDLEKPYFIQISVLNELRRNAFENHINIRKHKHNLERKTIEKNNVKYPKSEIDFMENIANSKSAEFYKRHGIEEIKQAFEIEKPKNSVPILTAKYCLKYELGYCHKNENLKKIDFIEPLFIENNKRKLRLEFDCKNCVMKIMS